MLFNSVEYIALLAVALAAYWLSPRVWLRQGVVLAASFWFYMSWSRVFMLMLLGLLAVNWAIGWQLSRTRKRGWLVLACVINLGLLAWFKYAKFFLENLLAMAGLFQPGIEAPQLAILLPLGISFYVFELISYQADIYRGEIAHERNPAVFSLFVLFFPHLIAGPICRAGQFMPQLRAMQPFDLAKVYNGLYMFLAGFALKCGLADGVAPFVNVIFEAPATYSGFDNLMATAGFGVQILCDFWGYSLMALGAALLFGYVLPANFNAPYAALSIRDFWRRWHITLSNWLRDYLYIALGGSRHTVAWKVQRNLFLTMLLGGLWHGASWNFVIWGAIHGVALAVNRSFETSQRVPARLRGFLAWAPVAWLLTMAVVFSAWVFFRAPHLAGALEMLGRIVTPAPGWGESRIGGVFFELLLLYLPLQWLVHRTTWQRDMSVEPVRWQVPAVSLLALFATVYYVDGGQFIYFQF
jgi:alginate O-acetyltransferase complex protein AlgI